jgi:phage repressor protein C with HTH and peptisase S24 domain
MQEKRQEKSLIKQNILRFIARINITPYEFYKKSGVTRGILSQNNGISEDNIARFLALFPEVNTEWLLTGKGNMTKTDLKTESIKDFSSPSISDNPNLGKPYFDVDFIAGFDEIINSQVTIPANNIIIQGFEQADMWCNVSGHSMEPKISHGDIIALRKCTVEDIQYGEIYAVVMDTIRTIKIIRRSDDPEKLRFIPINIDNYDEKEYPVSRIHHIYEVIGSISKFF